MVFLECQISYWFSLTLEKQIKFVKNFLCGYWTKNVTVLTNLSLHVVYSIYYFLGFSQYICISFLKCLLLELFIMLHITFLKSEIKLATYKIVTNKMCLFWLTIATFSQFSPCNAMSSYLYKVNEKIYIIIIGNLNFQQELSC